MWKATVILVLFIQNADSFQVIEKRVSHPKGVDIGGKVTLACKSTEWWGLLIDCLQGRPFFVVFSSIGPEDSQNNIGFLLWWLLGDLHFISF